MDTPVLRYTVDVVVGDASRLADRIEGEFRKHDVAASCKATETTVAVEVSTLTLDAAEADEHARLWIEQASSQVSMRV